MARKKRGQGWFGDSPGHGRAGKGKTVPWANRTEQAKLNVKGQATLTGDEAAILTPGKKIDGSDLKDVEDIAGDGIKVTSIERVDSGKQGTIQKSKRDAKMDKYWDMYFDEKTAINDTFQIHGADGSYHIFEKDMVKEEIKSLPYKNQKQVQDKVVQVEYRNADINHFLEYVLQGLVDQEMA